MYRVITAAAITTTTAAAPAANKWLGLIYNWKFCFKLVWWNSVKKNIWYLLSVNSKENGRVGLEQAMKAKRGVEV